MAEGRSTTTARYRPLTSLPPTLPYTPTYLTQVPRYSTSVTSRTAHLFFLQLLCSREIFEIAPPPVHHHESVRKTSPFFKKYVLYQRFAPLRPPALSFSQPPAEKEKEEKGKYKGRLTVRGKSGSVDYIIITFYDYYYKEKKKKSGSGCDIEFCLHVGDYRGLCFLASYS